MGDCPINLPTLFIKVVPIKTPVQNWLEERWLAPKHRPGWELELAFSFDLVEVVVIEEGSGFGVIAILMAPAGIVLNSEAEGIVFDRINKSCIC